MFHVKHFGAAICGRRGIGGDVSRETILGRKEGRGMKILTARPHRLLAACVDRLGEATARGEGCMFLVPSQYTLQAELEIMERLHVSGSFLIDVLSPKRLQSRVFELAGMPKQTLFDERGKCMVLSSIIEAQKDELSVYRGAAQNGSSGFTARMSSMIASLKRSSLSAADVTRSAESMDAESPARAKLGDIARIYAAYEQRMAGELADAEDISREMRARFEASGVFKEQNVFVYGFDMITPTFAAELLALAIVIWQGGVSTELYNNFISGLRELGSYYTGNGIAIALETFAMLFVSLLVTCLLFYAPMSIGYSFANHKGLLSVVFYFVIQAVQQIFGVCTLAGLADDSSLLNHLLQNVFSGGRMVIVNGVVSEAPHAVAQFFHGAMLLSLLADLVLGAILYFLTYFMLRKRRNLQ